MSDANYPTDNLSELENREVKQRRRRRQRERQKYNRFVLAKHQIARTSHVFYISVESLKDYDVKLPKFTFCGGVDRTQRLSSSFPELPYTPLEFNSRKIRQHFAKLTRWIKFEAARTHFLSDVFVAVAVTVAVVVA